MSTNCIAVSKTPSPLPLASVIPTATIASPATPITPDIISPITQIRRSSSSQQQQQQQCDTDSGKSSCSPALLDCSFDSGICVEVSDVTLHRQLLEFKRILITLERDREMYRLLRERLSKIVDRKNKKQKQEDVFCNVCCAEIDPENIKCFVQCSVCQKVICRGTKCADWIPSSAQWECQLCHASKESLAQTSSWVAEQASFNQHKFVYPMRARSEIYIPISDQNECSLLFESVSQVGSALPTPSVAATTITAEQKLKIREYVEEVVAQMLGGSLDNVAVGRLSKSENYLQLFRKYHSKLSNLFINMENALYASMHTSRDLPALANGVLHPNSSNTNNNNNAAPSNYNSDLTDISHARLRQLIETIIAETLRLQPALSSSTAVSEVAIDTHSNGGTTNTTNTLPNGDARRHRTEHYFEPKIYQELLATAVLNKIADTHGNARHLRASGPDLIATADVNKNFKEHPSTLSSGSSVEPHSDCSFTDTDQILNLGKGEDFSPCGSNANLNAEIIAGTQLDPGRESALSDYIAAHMVPLPDLSAPVTESEEDDYVSVTSSQLGDGNWEDNWLFKKKKSSLKTPVTSGGVGMLVPAPKEDVRAQIGDKIADETSDLSEMGSETDDSSLDLMRGGQLDPLNDRLLNKHLIGGQNTKMVLDELIDSASVISCTSPAENESAYTETKNTHVVKLTTKTEAINTAVTKSVLSHSPPSTDTNTEPSEPVILPPPMSFDDGDIVADSNLDAVTNGTNCDNNANPITASINLIEALQATEGCTGFSTEVEVFDTDPSESSSQLYGDAAIPSVVEILAAIALGPMLAVPASEQHSVLTTSEMTSLKELSDLALAEIRARSPDPSYQMLGVIPEENIEHTSLEPANNDIEDTIEIIPDINLDSELKAAEAAPLQSINNMIVSSVNSDCTIPTAVETAVATSVALIVAHSENVEETVTSATPLIETKINLSSDAAIEDKSVENILSTTEVEVFPTSAAETVILSPVVAKDIEINVPPPEAAPPTAEVGVSQVILNRVVENVMSSSIIDESKVISATSASQIITLSAAESDVSKNVSPIGEILDETLPAAGDTVMGMAESTENPEFIPPIIVESVSLPLMVMETTQNIAETINCSTEEESPQVKEPLSIFETVLLAPVLTESLEKNAPPTVEIIDSPSPQTTVEPVETEEIVPPPIFETVNPSTIVVESRQEIVSPLAETINDTDKIESAPKIVAQPMDEEVLATTLETDSRENVLPLTADPVVNPSGALDVSQIPIANVVDPETVFEPVEVEVIVPPPIIETVTPVPVVVESTLNIVSSMVETINNIDKEEDVPKVVAPPIDEAVVSPPVVTASKESVPPLVDEAVVNPAEASELSQIPIAESIIPPPITETVVYPIEAEEIVPPPIIETVTPAPVLVESTLNIVSSMVETVNKIDKEEDVPKVVAPPIDEAVVAPPVVTASKESVPPLVAEVVVNPAETLEECFVTTSKESALPLVADPVVNPAEALDVSQIPLAESITSPPITETAVDPVEAEEIAPPPIIETVTPAPVVETINNTDKEEDVPEVVAAPINESVVAPPVVTASKESVPPLVAEAVVNPAEASELSQIPIAESIIPPPITETVVGPIEAEEIVPPPIIETVTPAPVVVESNLNIVSSIVETINNIGKDKDVPKVVAPPIDEAVANPPVVTTSNESVPPLVDEAVVNPAEASELSQIPIAESIIPPPITETVVYPIEAEEIVPPPIIETVTPAPVLVESTLNIVSSMVETVNKIDKEEDVPKVVAPPIDEAVVAPPVVTASKESVPPLVAEAVVNHAEALEVSQIPVVEFTIPPPVTETTVEPAEAEEIVPPPIIETVNPLPIIIESTQDIVSPLAETIKNTDKVENVAELVAQPMDEALVAPPVVTASKESVLPLTADAVVNPSGALDVSQIPIAESIIPPPITDTVVDPVEAEEIAPPPIIETVTPAPVVETINNTDKEENVPEVVGPPSNEAAVAPPAVTASKESVPPLVAEAVVNPAEALDVLQIPIAESIIPPPITETVVGPIEAEEIVPPPIIETVTPAPVLVESTLNIVPSIVETINNIDKDKDVPLVVAPPIYEAVVTPPVVTTSKESVPPLVAEAVVNPAEATELSQIPITESIIPPPITETVVYPIEAEEIVPPPIIETVTPTTVLVESTLNIVSAIVETVNKIDKEEDVSKVVAPPIDEAVVAPPVVTASKESVPPLVAEAVVNPAEALEVSQIPVVEFTIPPPVTETTVEPVEAEEIVPPPIIETVNPLPIMVESTQDIVSPLAETINNTDKVENVVELVAQPMDEALVAPPVVTASKDSVLPLTADAVVNPSEALDVSQIPIAESIISPPITETAVDPVEAEEIVPPPIIETVTPAPVVETINNTDKDEDVPKVVAPPINEAVVAPPVVTASKESVPPLVAEASELSQIPIAEFTIPPLVTETTAEPVETEKIMPPPIFETVNPLPIIIESTQDIVSPLAETINKTDKVESVAELVVQPMDEAGVAPPVVTTSKESVPPLVAEAVVNPAEALDVSQIPIAEFTISPPITETIVHTAEAEEIVPPPIIEIVPPAPVVETINNTDKKEDVPQVVAPPIDEAVVTPPVVTASKESVPPLVAEAVVNPAEALDVSQIPIAESIIPPPIIETVVDPVEGEEIMPPPIIETVTPAPVVETINNTDKEEDVPEVVAPPIDESVVAPPAVTASMECVPALVADPVVNPAEASELSQIPIAESIIPPSLTETVVDPVEAEEIVPAPIIETVTPAPVVVESTLNIVSSIVETTNNTDKEENVPKVVAHLIDEAVVSPPVVTASKESIPPLIADPVVNPAEALDVSQIPIAESIIPPPLTETVVDPVEAEEIVPAPIIETVTPAPVVETINNTDKDEDVPKVVASPIDEAVVSPPVVTASKESVRPLIAEPAASPAEALDVLQIPIAESIILPPITETVVDPAEGEEIMPPPIIETVTPAPVVETINNTDKDEDVPKVVASPINEAVVAPPVVTASKESVPPLIADPVVNPAEALDVSQIPFAESIILPPITETVIDPAEGEEIMPAPIIETVTPAPVVVESTLNIVSSIVETTNNTDKEEDVPKVVAPPIDESVVAPPVVTASKESIPPLIADPVVNPAEALDVSQIPIAESIILPPITETVVDPVEGEEIVPAPIIETVTPAPVVVESTLNIVSSIVETTNSADKEEDVPKVVAPPIDESVVAPPVVTASKESVPPLIADPVVNPAEALDVSQIPIAESIILPPITETVVDPAEGEEIMPAPIIETVTPAPVVVESTLNIVSSIVETTNNADKEEDVPKVVAPPVNEAVVAPPVVTASKESVPPLIADSVVNPAVAFDVSQIPFAESIIPPPITPLIMETVAPAPVVETINNTDKDEDVPKVVAPPINEAVVAPPVVTASKESVPPLIADSVVNPAVAFDVSQIPIAESIIPPPITPLIMETVTPAPVVETTNNADKEEDVPKVVAPPINEAVVAPPVVTASKESVPPLIADSVVNPAVAFDVSQIPIAESIIPPPITPLIIETVTPAPVVVESTLNIVSSIVETTNNADKEEDVPKVVAPPIDESVVAPPVVTASKESIPPLIADPVVNPALDVLQIPIAESISPPPITETVVDPVEGEEIMPAPIIETVTPAPVMETINNTDKEENVPKLVAPPINEAVVAPPVITASKESVPPLIADPVVNPVEALDVSQIPIAESIIPPPINETVVYPIEAEEIVPPPTIEAVSPPPVVVESSQNIVLPSAGTIYNIDKMEDVSEIVALPIDEAVLASPLVTESKKNVSSLVANAVVNPVEALDVSQIPIVEYIIPPPLTEIVVDPVEAQENVPPPTTTPVTPSPVIGESIQDIASPLAEVINNTDKIEDVYEMIAPQIDDAENKENISPLTTEDVVSPSETLEKSLILVAESIIPPPIEAEEIVPPPFIETMTSPPVVVESTQNIVSLLAKTINNTDKTEDVPEIVAHQPDEAILAPPEITESKANVLSLIADAAVNPVEAVDVSHIPIVEPVISPPIIDIVVHPVKAEESFPTPIIGAVPASPVLVESTLDSVSLLAETISNTGKTEGDPEIVALQIHVANLTPPGVTEDKENVSSLIVDDPVNPIEVLDVTQISIVKSVISSSVSETVEKEENLPPPNVKTVTHTPVVEESTQDILSPLPENISNTGKIEEVPEIVASLIDEAVLAPHVEAEDKEKVSRIVAEGKVNPANELDASQISVVEDVIPPPMVAETIENIVIPVAEITVDSIKAVEIVAPSETVETVIPVPSTVETVISSAEKESPDNVVPQIVETAINYEPPIVETVIAPNLLDEISENIASPVAESSEIFPPSDIPTLIPSPTVVEGTESMTPPATENVETAPSATLEFVNLPSVVMERTKATEIVQLINMESAENTLSPPIVEAVTLPSVVKESTENCTPSLNEIILSPVESAELTEIVQRSISETYIPPPLVKESIENAVPPIVTENIENVAAQVAVNLVSTTESTEVTDILQPSISEIDISLPSGANSTELIMRPITDTVTESPDTISYPSAKEIVAPIAQSVTESLTTTTEVSETTEATALTEAVPTSSVLSPTTEATPAVVIDKENIASPMIESVAVSSVAVELLETIPASLVAETDMPESAVIPTVETVISPTELAESTDLATPQTAGEVRPQEVTLQEVIPATAEILLSPVSETSIASTALSKSTECVAPLAATVPSPAIVTGTQEVVQSSLSDADVTKIVIAPSDENNIVSKEVPIQLLEITLPRSVENSEIVSPEVVKASKVDTVIASSTEAQNEDTFALPIAKTATETAVPEIVPAASIEDNNSRPCLMQAEVAETLPSSVAQIVVASTTKNTTTENISYAGTATELSNSLLPQVTEHAAAIAPPAIVSQEVSAADDTIASSSTVETVIATPVIVPDTDLIKTVPPPVDEITPQEIVAQTDNLDNKAISDVLPPDKTHVVGNISRRGLTRQCNVIDTTPSVDEAQPKGVSLLATICKCYIKDKRLLKSLENRRRQTILIQRYLNSFDSTESEECPNDILLTERTTIFTPETPCPIEFATEHEDFVVGELNEMSFNFFNNVLFSDQLSSDSNNTEGSIATAVETFASDDRSPAAQLCAATAQCDEYEYGFNSSSIVLTPATNHHFAHKNTTSTATTKINTATTTVTNHKTNTATNFQLTNGSIAGVHKSAACSEEPPLSDDEEQEHVDDDLVVLRRFVPGSIAEREYKKWYNAVDMPNNPYAPEALKRRISGSQERFIDLPNISPSTEQNPISLIQNASKDEIDQSEERDYKRYSRDYYINDSKQSSTSAATTITNSLKSGSTTTLTGGSQESTADIIINEAQIANTTATAIKANPSQDEHIFQAIPAQVVEDPASLDTQSTLSNQSLQSTTTSDDSDTIRIYDFKKQETTIIRDQSSNIPTSATSAQLSTSLTQSTSVESNTMKESLQNAPVVARKTRPTELAISGAIGSNSGDAAITLGIAGVMTSPYTPTRGSTPTAFKFLQPKRKLIEPNQVLSVDEDDMPPPTPVERKTIEEDVAQALPSVKALAQAFLLTSHKRNAVENRCAVKPNVKTSITPTEENVIRPLKPLKSTRPPPVPIKQNLEASPSYAEAAEDATIASDLSSLETDPPTHQEAKDSKAAAEKTRPTPLRTGFLKSNIAFFENLKFK